MYHFVLYFSPDLKEHSPSLLVTDVDNIVTPPSTPSEKAVPSLPVPTPPIGGKQRKFIIVSKIDRRVSFRHRRIKDPLTFVKRSSSWEQKLSRPISVNLPSSRELKDQTEKDPQPSNIFENFPSKTPLETDIDSVVDINLNTTHDGTDISRQTFDHKISSEVVNKQSNVDGIHQTKSKRLRLTQPTQLEAENKNDKQISFVYKDSEISLVTDTCGPWSNKTLSKPPVNETVVDISSAPPISTELNNKILLPSMSTNVDVNVARWVSTTLPEEEIVKHTTADDLELTPLASTQQQQQHQIPDNSSDSTISQEIQQINNKIDTNQSCSNVTSNSAVNAVVCTSVNMSHVRKSEEQFPDKQIIVKIPDHITRQMNNTMSSSDIGEDITVVTDFTDNNNNTMEDQNIVSVNEKNKRNSQKSRDSWDFFERPEKLLLTTKNTTTKHIEKGVIVRNTSKEMSSLKHKSWDILELKAHTANESSLEKFISSLADVPEKKRDSLNIEHLFKQYQKEREALRKLRETTSGNTRRSDSISDFSDISSLSDDDDANSNRESWYQDISEIDEPEISHNKALGLEFSPRSAFALVKTNNITRTESPETQASTSDPAQQLREVNSSLTVPSPNNSKSESTKQEIVEIKPLPSPSKPDFVPEITSFNEEDLGNMVMAQAVSAVRKRRGARGRRAIDTEEPPPPIAGLTSIPDVETNTTPQEEPSKTPTPSSSPGMCATEDKEVGKKENDPARVSHVNQAASPKVPRAVVDMQPSESPRLTRSKQTWAINQADEREQPVKTTNSTQPSDIKKRPVRANTFSSKSSAKPAIYSRQSFGEERAKDELKQQSNSILRNTIMQQPNARSYDYVNSMPNLHIKSRLSSELPKNYDSEGYLSEASFASDTGLESCLEGSIVDDQVFLYPSMHKPTKDAKNKPLGEEFSDSSGDESFTTEQSDRFNRLTSRETERTVSCGNPPCSRRQHIIGQQKSQFISCNSCFTCYCSKTCKRMHWKEHRKTCFFGRISVYIKALIRKCERDAKLNADLRHLSLHNHQLKGRGCLLLSFDSPSEAKAAAVSEGKALLTTPTYSIIDTIVKKDKKTKHSRILHQSIIDYDPEQEFVVNISIKIGKTNTSGSKKRVSNVVRCARISMLSREDANGVPSKLLSSYYIRTFCLPKVAVVEYMNDTEVRRYYCKELSFSLKRCGVRLKADYPEAYEKLCSYVEDEKPFLPIVLYGQRSGKNFKCILHQGKYNPTEEARGEGVLV